MRILLIIGLLALVGCSGRRPEAATPVAVTERPEAIDLSPVVATSPVVEVRALRDGIYSTGVGCVIEARGQRYVVTAWHIINEGGELSLWQNGKRLQATLGAPRHRDDAAVIPVTGELIAMPASFEAPHVGQRITVQGTLRGAPTVLHGEITQISVRSTAPLELGLSGAPVVAGNKCIGISTSISTLTAANGRSESGASHIMLNSIEDLF